MATVAHTIYSHYDPKDREFLGQIPSTTTDFEDQWRKENQVYKRPLSAGPVFVPAKIADGEWASYATSPTLENNSKGKDNVAEWYKTLTDTAPAPGPSQLPSNTTPMNHDRQMPNCRKRIDKNNWFIQNVISASTTPTTTPIPFSISSTPTPHTPSSPPTLAEILEREPPPSKTEAKYAPPVWIALGPGNRGFGLLQKSGWNEGEALGPYARRRAIGMAHDTDVSTLFEGSQGERRWKGKAKEDTIKVEFVEVPFRKVNGKRVRPTSDDDDEIMELRKVEVVDLTELSDVSETEDEHPNEEQQVEEEVDSGAIPDTHGHGGTALLTPISTILKSDRLGIGLKPKLVSSASAKGAYRVPVLKDTRRNQGFSSKGFRVTNTKGVLDEIRRREQEEKREREVWGRGGRGKERRRRREESERRGLLAYMNK